MIDCERGVSDAEARGMGWWVGRMIEKKEKRESWKGVVTWKVKRRELRRRM